ncbi:MAG TPA: hypothetical protein VGF67_09450 [Ktedonobacteraceae bacterium]
MIQHAIRHRSEFRRDPPRTTGTEGDLLANGKAPVRKSSVPAPQKASRLPRAGDRQAGLLWTRFRLLDACDPIAALTALHNNSE